MRCAALLVVLLPAVSTGAAQPPPDALAEPVREALAPAVTAADHGWTVWPVREAPVGEGVDNDLGQPTLVVAVGGVVVGVVVEGTGEGG